MVAIIRIPHPLVSCLDLLRRSPASFPFSKFHLLRVYYFDVHRLLLDTGNSADVGDFDGIGKNELLHELVPLGRVHVAHILLPPVDHLRRDMERLEDVPDALAGVVFLLIVLQAHLLGDELGGDGCQSLIDHLIKSNDDALVGIVDAACFLLGGLEPDYLLKVLGLASSSSPRYS